MPYYSTARLCLLPNVQILTGVQALCHGGGLNQVAFTDIAGDEMIEILHQVFPL